MPALVTNHRFDVVASNDLARRLTFDFRSAHDANLARYLFLDPASHRRYRDCQVALATVGQLRAASARHRHDQKLAHLIGVLMLRGDHFADLWATGEVVERRMAPRDSGRSRSVTSISALKTSIYRATGRCVWSCSTHSRPPPTRTDSDSCPPWAARTPAAPAPLAMIHADVVRSPARELGPIP
ncbi:MAG: hypothetical protein ACQSGP_05860 [Frankia sp.]